MKETDIVQALRCCAEGECKDCAMHEDMQRCQENLLDKAAEAIERLTAENAELREKVPRWISVEDRLPEAWKDEDGVLVNYIFTPQSLVQILATITRWTKDGCAWRYRSLSPTGCRCRKRRRKKARHESLHSR